MKTALHQTRAPRSFRVLLQAELARRAALNPRYSLRAFARWLGVSHATLSQILRRERTITPRTIEELGPMLGLDPDGVRDYTNDEPLAAMAIEPEDGELARHAAEVVGDWHHFAILELIHVRSFRPDVRWIAGALGITSDDVDTALARLLRLRLLEMRGPVWVDLSENVTARFDDATAAAAHRLFADLRTLAARTMAGRDARSSTHSVTTLAVDTRKLPLAVAAIETFRAELAELLRGGTPDAVATFEIHLFPITRASS